MQCTTVEEGGESRGRHRRKGKEGKEDEEKCVTVAELRKGEAGAGGLLWLIFELSVSIYHFLTLKTRFFFDSVPAFLLSTLHHLHTITMSSAAAAPAAEQQQRHITPSHLFNPSSWLSRLTTPKRPETLKTL